jgi:hypothetical protein
MAIADQALLIGNRQSSTGNRRSFWLRLPHGAGASTVIFFPLFARMNGCILRSKTSSFFVQKTANSFIFAKTLSSFPLKNILFAITAHLPTLAG